MTRSSPGRRSSPFGCPVGYGQCRTQRTTHASPLLVLLLVVGLISLDASGAAAQAPLAHDDSTLLMRLDPPIRSAVVPMVDTAGRAGLPVGPLIDKALEGQTKGAPPDRIAVAVRGLAARVGEARDALGANATPMDLAAGASALRAGVSPAVLTALRGARPQQPLAVPLGVIAELVARGVSPDTASSAVLALARKGATDANLVTLRQDVDQDLAAGVAPSVSAVQHAADLGGTLGFTAPTAVTPTPDIGYPRPRPPRPTRP
jgi:hypothetical protein